MISAICAFCTRRPFWVAPRRPNILKVFWNSQGVAKKREKPGFLWLSQVHVLIVPFRLLMVTCRLDIPSCCKCFIRPCILIFVVMLFFFAVGLFPCVYPSLSLLRSLFCVQLFVFAVFSLGVTKTKIKSQNISNFDCHLLLRCLHPHTFTWPR